MRIGQFSIGKNLNGSGHGLCEGTVLAFAEETRKQQKTSS
jgi:hypothetical protein